MGRSRKRRVVLRPRADLDIDSQFEYLFVEAGLATAKRFLRAFKDSCTALQENPHLGSPRTLNDPRLTGVRMWPVKGFRQQLIFYIPQPHLLEIVRVLHAARDVESLLGQ